MTTVTKISTPTTKAVVKKTTTTTTKTKTKPELTGETLLALKTGAYPDPDKQYRAITQWINTVAGGQPNNIKIVPLNNVDKKAAQPVPFGFIGKPTGLRARIITTMIKGIDGKGDTSLGKILDLYSKEGHSRKRPNVLLGLLCGGMSTKSATYGTPFVKLQVK